MTDARSLLRAASPLDPAATCTIMLTFTPSAAGPRPGTLTITTSRNVVPLAIPIAGTGVSP
jgi:hypothetical protein